MIAPRTHSWKHGKPVSRTPAMHAVTALLLMICLVCGTNPPPSLIPQRGSRCAARRCCSSHIRDGAIQAALSKLPDNGLVRGVKLLHAALPHHRPLVQEDEPVHCAPDGRVLVRDHNVGGDALAGRAIAVAVVGAVQAAHEVLHHGGGHRVQACCGLVVHDDLLVVVAHVGDDRARQRHTLLHAARQLSRVELLHAAQPHLA
mmetsp:Transcript_27596/g.70297  ORF Transcript_27596/g.70297 Transcript_27596/m.70297 type:complete len:202 (+) Transcript_27596:274-879(+)